MSTYDNPWDLAGEPDVSSDPGPDIEALIAADPLAAASFDNRLPAVGAAVDQELARVTQQQLLLELARREARKQADEKQASDAALRDLKLDVANVDDLPVSLAGTQPTLTQDELEEAMKTRSVTLFDALKMARKEKATPTLLEVGDTGRCVFYRGKSNWMFGESGKGKSNIAKKAVYDEAKAGRASLFIDREKDIVAFAETMVEFGDLTDTEASLIFYWNPTKSTEQLMPTLLGFVRKYGIDLVVIDSCSRDIVRFSPTAKENDNDDIRRWYNACVEPIVRLGATPLVIDHVVKPPTGMDGKAMASEVSYAKGGVAKREVVTGIAVAVRTVKPFSKTQDGYAKIVCVKDNNGPYTEGEVIAEFHVKPGVDRSTFELKASANVVAADGKMIPTQLMENASRWLEQQNATGTSPSKNAAVVALGTSSKAIRERAVDMLISEGWATVTDGGPGKAKELTSARPYRQSDDPRIAQSKGDDQPPAQRGFGGGGRAALNLRNDPFDV